MFTISRVALANTKKIISKRLKILGRSRCAVQSTHDHSWDQKASEWGQNQQVYSIFFWAKYEC